MAILAGAGYLLHTPLIGQKGIFVRLIQPTEKVVATTGGTPTKLDPITDTGTSPDTPATGGVDPVKGGQNPPIQDNVFTPEKLIAADYPDVCTMVRSGFASIPGGTLPLDIGDQLKPISIRGTDIEVVVVKLGVTGTVPMATTDFIKLALPRYMARKNGKAQPITGGDTPKPKPDDVVTNTNPNPRPKPPVKVDPIPRPKPKPTLVKVSDTEIKQLMQNGYKSVSVFSGSDLIGVEIGSVETIGEIEYQTGILKFKRDTLLGVRELSAKALILNGKLEKWVWTKSGQTIR